MNEIIFKTHAGRYFNIALDLERFEGLSSYYQKTDWRQLMFRLFVFKYSNFDILSVSEVHLIELKLLNKWFFFFFSFFSNQIQTLFEFDQIHWMNIF